MRLLLINPPNLENDKKLTTEAYSIGLLTLYNVASINGFDVDIKNVESIEKLLEINLDDYNLVGIPCYTRQRYSVFKTAKIIKERNPAIKILIGGPHVLGLEIKILQNYKCCDYIISKEGELPLLLLLKELENRNEDLSSIPNLTWRKSSNVIKNHIKYNLNLDEIPQPYYHEEYFSSYAKNARGGLYFKKTSAICAMNFSRGCNNTCIFCANQACFGKQRFFSNDYIKKLLFDVYNKNVSTFHFVDDDFCADQSRVVDLCNWIIGNNINIQWRCSTRANNINPEIVSKMISAGCKMISIGLESGSQKVLDTIGKNYIIEEIVQNLIEIKKLNIEIRFSLTFGYECENLTAYDETASIINQIKPNAVAFFFLKVYPGTPLYKEAVKMNYINDDYWFKNEKSVPFFELYKKYSELNGVVKYILSKLNASLISGYNENRDDAEYYLNWK